MNYIKLINAFYDRLETNSLSTSAIALWHALVHVNNKAGWLEEFTVAVSVLCIKTGLSDRTITNARNDLKMKGYLDFRSRKGSKSAVYILNDLSANISYNFANNEVLSEIVSCNLSDNLSCNVSDNLSGNVSALNKLKETKQNKTKILTAATHANYFDEYMICFGRQPNPIQIEEINSFIDQDGLSVDVVCSAFKKAAEAGAKYAYARSILNSWINKGIRTMADVQNEQSIYEQRKQQNRNKSRTGYAPKRTEMLPDWFHENNELTTVDKPKKSAEDIERDQMELKEMIRKMRAE